MAITEFDLQKAITGAKVMTRSRSYVGQYLLTMQSCPHVYIYVFKMNGPDGEKLIQVDENGKYSLYRNDVALGIFMGAPDDLIMAPEVKTVYINFYLDSNNRVHCTEPQESELDAFAINNAGVSGQWHFIKTEKIVIEY